jgi:hypothetical protein
MLKKTFLLLIVFSSPTFSQSDHFSFSESGLSDYVVTNTEGESQKQLYQKTIDWVLKTYSDPSEVIKSQIENEYIRIEGSTSELICYSALGKRCGETKYQIEISFKDGKYKFDVLHILEYNTQTRYNSVLWTEFNITDASDYYKNSGKIKSVYKYIETMVPDYFNSINADLKTFIKNDLETNIKNDW